MESFSKIVCCKVKFVKSIWNFHWSKILLQRHGFSTVFHFDLENTTSSVEKLHYIRTLLYQGSFWVLNPKNLFCKRSPKRASGGSRVSSGFRGCSQAWPWILTNTVCASVSPTSSAPLFLGWCCEGNKKLLLVPLLLYS